MALIAKYFHDNFYSYYKPAEVPEPLLRKLENILNTYHQNPR